MKGASVKVETTIGIKTWHAGRLLHQPPEVASAAIPDTRQVAALKTDL